MKKIFDDIISLVIKLYANSHKNVYSEYKETYKCFKKNYNITNNVNLFYSNERINIYHFKNNKYDFIVFGNAKKYTLYDCYIDKLYYNKYEFSHIHDYGYLKEAVFYLDRLLKIQKIKNL